jgi:hypothetical protein
MTKLPEQAVKLYRVLDQTIEVHGYTKEQMLQFRRDALEEVLKFFQQNDTVLFWGSQAAKHIQELKDET